MNALRRPSSAKLKVLRKMVLYRRMLHPFKTMSRRERKFEIQNSSARAMSLMVHKLWALQCLQHYVRVREQGFFNSPSVGIKPFSHHLHVVINHVIVF